MTLPNTAGSLVRLSSLPLSFRFLIDGLVLPVVEELYFRGYLLPRGSCSGRSRSLVNAGLFTIYHLWQPFNYLTIFVFALLLGYTVRRAHDQCGWESRFHVLLNLIVGVLALMIMI